MRVVLCHGVWDVLHESHVRTLEWAKSLGDRLVVTVTPDRHIRSRKGASRPIYPMDARLHMLWSLGCVDWALPAQGKTALWSLGTFRPQVWVRGSDWKGRTTPASLREEALARRLGTEIAFAPLWEPDYRTTDVERIILKG